MANGVDKDMNEVNFLLNGEISPNEGDLIIKDFTSKQYPKSIVEISHFGINSNELLVTYGGRRDSFKVFDKKVFLLSGPEIKVMTDFINPEKSGSGSGSIDVSSSGAEIVNNFHFKVNSFNKEFKKLGQVQIVEPNKNLIVHSNNIK